MISFRLKLGLAFGLILFLTIIVAMTSIYGMNRALKHQKELYGFTYTLEEYFQSILREKQAFISNGRITHSRSVINLVSQINIKIRQVSDTLQDQEQKQQIDNVLLSLSLYEKSFAQLSGNTVDMETMKSRLLHESRRLSVNARAIEKIGGSAVRILKVMNEMLLAEGQYIREGKHDSALYVLDNAGIIIGLADGIRNQSKDSSTKLYAFRISNITSIYQSSFRQYQALYNYQLKLISDMDQNFIRFEQELDHYIKMVSDKEQKIISLLKDLVVLISLIAIILAIFATFFLSILITNPINDLKKSAETILSGRFDSRVRVKSRDEIGELGTLFNQMTKKLQENFDNLAQYKDHLEDLVRNRTRSMEDEIKNHQETQIKLKNEKDRALQYFDIAGSILVVLNSDGTVNLINKAGSSVLGLEKEEIIGKNWFEWFIPDSIRENVKARFQKLMQGEIESIEFTESRIVNKQGQERMISWHNNVIRDHSNTIIASLSSGEDITDMIEMEKDKRQLESRLQQARKMEAIGTLAGGIAHDFNNILFPIMGNAELAMADLDETSKIRKKLENILNGAVRAKDLIQQILAFSRQKQQVKKPLKIQPVIKEALKLLRSTIPKHIEIKQMVSEKSYPVLGDPTEIYEIIMNLCTNAYHAMEQNGGLLTVKFSESVLPEDEFKLLNLKHGHYCVLSVHDTGSGIPESIMNQIFEPYFTTKKIGKGSGLGLSVIHGIVKNYGGTITVTSEIDKGTDIYIYLPVIDTQEIQPPAESQENQALHMRGDEHVLFVDDEIDIVKMGIQILENLGYTITGQTSSYDAFRTFQADPELFDLVITDMAMPGMLGTELIRKLQEIKPGIKVIICTGFSDQINAVTAKSLGINGFIRKPILINELSSKIREVLDSDPGESI